MLGACYVTSTVVGAGAIEVKDGAVSHFQQGRQWSTQESHPVQIGEGGPGIGGVGRESFLKRVVSSLSSEGLEAVNQGKEGVTQG